MCIKEVIKMSKKKRVKRKKINGQFTPITRAMRLSEAWRALSCRAVWIWIEMMGKYKGDELEKFPFPYKKEFKKYMGKRQFYAARKEVVDLGFFDVDEEDKGGLKRRRTKFKVSVRWKSISIKMKEEKDRAAQSERDKKLFKDLGLNSLLEEGDKSH